MLIVTGTISIVASHTCHSFVSENIHLYKFLFPRENYRMMFNSDSWWQ